MRSYQCVEQCESDSSSPSGSRLAMTAPLFTKARNVQALSCYTTSSWADNQMDGTSTMPEEVAVIAKRSKTSVDTSADKEARKRERHRVCMARYRKKLQDKQKLQEDAMKTLQDQVQHLQEQKQLLSSRALTPTTPWSVAGEYFRLFRFGSRSPNLTMSTVVDPYDPRVQLDFMRATMATDVVFGTVCGAEAVLDNWKYISLCYEDMDIQLKSLECDKNQSILATTTATFTVTESTLQYAFPHLLSSEQWTPLVAKLLGQRIRMGGFLRFDWDSETKRVDRLVYSSDLLTPLLELLGSLESVSRVFDSARVTPESRLANENLLAA